MQDDGASADGINLDSRDARAAHRWMVADQSLMPLFQYALPVSAQVDQYHLPQSGPSPWAKELRAQWHALVRALGRHVGLSDAQLVSLHVQDEKLLIAVRQTGEQAPHFGESAAAMQSRGIRAADVRWLPADLFLPSRSACTCVSCPDRDDTAEHLLQVFSILLYLTDDADCTAFPRFRLDEFALPRFDQDDEVLNAAELRTTVERGLLEKQAYDRWPTRVGDMALFTQATMVRRDLQRGDAVCIEMSGGVGNAI